ncbi:MAG: hypothetical protein ACLP59_33495 [Bryobacteraceae bacterium]
MLISEKQHEANQRNAENSTGPKTPEGKQAVKFNALKYGLHARSTILPYEDLAEFDELWEGFHKEWKPATRAENHYFDQMFTSHWLLARLARGECRIYSEEKLTIPQQLELLEQISKQRARLERSFTEAMHELQALQKERNASETKSHPKKEPNRATYSLPQPAEPKAVVCASADTR